MKSNMPVTVGALALFLLIGAAVVHAREGDEPKGGSDIGMVDLEKIYEASDAPQQFGIAAAGIETDAQARVESISGLSQLSENELKEYGELVGLKLPDAKQKVRMEELKDFNEKRTIHLRDLQTKPDAQLTAEDRKLMTSSAQQKRQFDRMMVLMQSDVRQQVSEREDIVKRGLIAQLRMEVSKVAKEKKILHVFDITAMVTSSNDLTAAVIQRIKKPNK